MSGYSNNYSDVLDSDGFEEQQTGSGLRKQLEEALGELKTLRGTVHKLQQKPATEDLLKEKGLNPAVADAIPDGQDPGEWIEKFGHLFGAGVQTGAESEPEVVEHDPALDEERAALEQVQNQSSNTGISSSATADQIEKLKSFSTEAELLSYIRSGGAG